LSDRAIRRRLRRLSLLAATAALPLILWALLPVVSEGASPQSRLDQLQQRISSTQSRIGRRKGTEHLLTTQISAWTARIDALQAQIGRLQRRQAAVEADLAVKQAQLERIQVALRHERSRLVRLQARLKQARAALAQRLVDLYQADAPDIVTVILDAKGFADLLERGEFMRRVSEQDQRIFKLVRSARADAQASADRLAGLQRRQKQVTDRILANRDAIAAVKQQLIGTQAGYASTRAAKQQALGNVHASRVQLEGDLAGLKAQQAKIRATLMQAASGAVGQGSGQLIWPVNGPITSPFCERRAWESCHPGIDIGVPSGTPIRAAAAGKVVLMEPASASGGYGNFTCIQHTAAMATCYAHQSRFATSLGATVSQGQVIGYTGCTGLCFGPHLHFEVRINGSVVNPVNYL
jgi:murein DD-endopeptidase MepM/ murein hydrolase activator NlpD